MKALNSCTNSFTGCGTVPASGSDVVFKWTTQTGDVSVLNGSHVAHKLNLEVNTFGQPTLLFNHRLERVNERTTRWPSQQPENTQPPLVSDQHPSHPLSPFVIKIMIRASFYIYASVCTLRLTAFRADLFLCLSFCRYQNVKVSRGGESRGELTIGGCRWDALCWAACGERSSCVIIFIFLNTWHISSCAESGQISFSLFPLPPTQIQSATDLNQTTRYVWLSDHHPHLPSVSRHIWCFAHFFLHIMAKGMRPNVSGYGQSRLCSILSWWF